MRLEADDKVIENPDEADILNALETLQGEAWLKCGEKFLSAAELAKGGYIIVYQESESEGMQFSTNRGMPFSKPYFDRGNAWSFTAVERHIYFSADGRMAWFDELLDTWMQLCRGSGVAVLTEDGWKVSHYVLSLTMPNDAVNAAIALKKEADSLTIRGLRTLKTN